MNKLSKWVNEDQWGSTCAHKAGSCSGYWTQALLPSREALSHDPSSECLRASISPGSGEFSKLLGPSHFSCPPPPPPPFLSWIDQQYWTICILLGLHSLLWLQAFAHIFFWSRREWIHKSTVCRRTGKSFRRKPNMGLSHMLSQLLPLLSSQATSLHLPESFSEEKIQHRQLHLSSIVWLVRAKRRQKDSGIWGKIDVSSDLSLLLTRGRLGQISPPFWPPFCSVK